MCVGDAQVLEGYVLQGYSGAALADRVLQGFKDSMHDVTLRVVRSSLLTSAKCVRVPTVCRLILRPETWGWWADGWERGLQYCMALQVHWQWSSEGCKRR